LAAWIAVTEQCRAQWLIKDSIQASFLEETQVVQDMAAREKHRGSKPIYSLSMLPDYADSSGESSGSPTPVRESISHMQPLESGSSEFVDLTTDMEFCILEFDSLLKRQEHQRCLEDLHLKHEALWNTLHAQFEESCASYADVEKKLHFHELQCRMLQEQYLLLTSRRQGLTISPHPGTHAAQRTEDGVPTFMRVAKIWNCAVCDQSFPNSDVILASCRHTYHP
jgi:hypothetical protein